MTDEETIKQRLREVEQDTALQRQAIANLDTKLTKMESDKIDPMRAQVNELHTTMTKNKGFWGGIFLAVGAIWSVFAGIGVTIWRVFTGNG